MSYFSTHNHSSYSNIRGLDSIIRLDEMIQYANDIGLNGICLSEHEVLSSHLKFLKEYKKLKKEGKIKDSFKVGLANEIYLVHENNIDELRENINNKNPMTKFYHFLLLARTKEGHKQLRKLSSLAWENYFVSFGVERVPTFKSSLKEVVKQGDIIASTACIGGFIGQNILREYNSSSEKEKISYRKLNDEFINFCIDVFGEEYFYLEIQPSNNPEQIIVNKELIKLSKQYGLNYIVATDGHYLKKEDRDAHKTYLQSQNAEREVDAFYEATYIQSESEVREYLSEYLTDDEIQIAFDNTMKIYNQIEEYSLEQNTIIPAPEIPEYEFKHILSKGYKDYPYIEKFAYSEYAIDRYYLHLIQEGLVEKIVKKRKANKEYFQLCLNRINTELREIWLISEKLNERVSGYYVLTHDIVKTIWNEGDSICGIARGSAGGYLTVYLLSIIEMNPLDYNLPHYRHLTAERPELPDIDLDSEQGKRAKILQAIKDKYGSSQVLNIATFGTEGSRSALLTAARGMEIDVDEVGYLTSLIPVERGFTWTLSDCFFGNEKKGRKPIKELINAVEKYEGLKENALRYENLIKTRSVHASGVYIFSQHYTEQNAMMKSSSGVPTTQFDMKDSDAQGALKVDLLTVQALDRIRYCLDSLVEYGYIKDLNNLKETYDSVLHPDVLEYENEEMWKKVGDNAIPDLFQMDTSVGLQSAQKVKPKSVIELSTVNSLMRLMAEDGKEQPVDKYVRHKNNPQEWIEEMESYGLTEDEIRICRKHLEYAYGVGESQEVLMELSMDKKIANFTVSEANQLRRIVGKKLLDEIPYIQNLFFTKGKEAGSSENILTYIWKTQVETQLAYSFSNIHSTAYSLIGLQEMNLVTKYPEVFWSTACLSVSASASDDSTDELETKKEKATKYGKVANSIGKIKRHGVEVVPPNINTAKFGFTPDDKNNQIIFGLKGIVGINDDIVHYIINNRPYVSFEDFHERLYKTKLLQRKHIIQLIKAGSFNDFGNPKQIMKKFILSEIDFKDKLTMQNMPTIIKMGLLDNKELYIYQELFNFKNYISSNISKVIPNPKETKGNKPLDRYFILNNNRAIEFYNENFNGSSIIGYYEDSIELSEKLFVKEYDKLMKPFKEKLTDKEFVKNFNKAQFIELWNKYAEGSLPKWEMDSLSYYYSGHELDGMNEQQYGISKFSKLPDEPIIVSEYINKKGIPIRKYKIDTIAGVCVEKDAVKHTFTLITTDGDVVTCKTHAGAFAYYGKQISVVENDKKKVLEKSWLSRGTLLLVRGMKRGNQFILKTYKSKDDSFSQHTINRILKVNNDGSLVLQDERQKI